MAMLRVSSYRRLFEDDLWSQRGGMSMNCAGQSRASVRSAAAVGSGSDPCECDKLDFVAAKSLNMEGLSRFSQERSVMAALNDRLVQLIELARCFEEENETLECQILELEERLRSRAASSSGVTSTVSPADFSLDSVVERLRQERDEILCDSEELQVELECLKERYEQTAEQRVFYQQERQDVAEVVDALTAECLALREQAEIYEEQLNNMNLHQRMAVEDILAPADETAVEVTAAFRSPDVTPALLLKNFYCGLAECLESECEAVSAGAVVLSDDAKQLEAGKVVGSKRKDLTKPEDIDEMKALVSELQKEVFELEQCNDELEDEMEMKRAANMEEICELKLTIDEMRQQQCDFQAQMRDQCKDYEQLLSEKMARDMEILAYRSLVEEEDERLCEL